MLTPADLTFNMGMNMMNSMVGGDGSFQFANVPPGRYNLQIRPQGMPTANSEIATLPIVVTNDDIDNLLVTTSVGAVARGVVMTDDGSLPSFKPDQVNIFPGPAEPGGMFFSTGNNRLNDDYTFELTGLFDRRLIRAGVGQGQSTGWYLKAVIYDGQDITDTGMEFAPGRAYEGLQVVFTQKTTDLSGLVTDDRGKPVLDATVVIFPANKDLWTYQSRYLRSLRPDTNGKYSIKSLPPADEYLIIAVQNLEPGQSGDPEFLARAREEAQSFMLNEGEFKTVDIKLSKLVP
jgi:hypothetical protein